MDATIVAKEYLTFLEQGDTDKVVALFAPNGMVHSPLYGSQPALQFYRRLAEDTRASQLKLKGIFQEEKAKRVAILFTYHWTLKNGVQTSFEVVDILEFNDALKIEKLTIIYDTQNTRKQVASL